MTDVRVRFAPSPTGSLHVGSARTALYNFLYARHNRGTMVLRIEDTDLKRSTTEHDASIINDLAWLGLRADEGPDVGGPYGPYRQSERADLYEAAVQQLLADGLGLSLLLPAGAARRAQGAATGPRADAQVRPHLLPPAPRTRSSPGWPAAKRRPSASACPRAT